MSGAIHECAEPRWGPRDKQLLRLHVHLCACGVLSLDGGLWMGWLQHPLVLCTLVPPAATLFHIPPPLHRHTVDSVPPTNSDSHFAADVATYQPWDAAGDDRLLELAAQHTQVGREEGGWLM